MSVMITAFGSVEYASPGIVRLDMDHLATLDSSDGGEDPADHLALALKACEGDDDILAVMDAAAELGVSNERLVEAALLLAKLSSLK